jgi:hypothetical protein
LESIVEQMLLLRLAQLERGHQSYHSVASAGRHPRNANGDRMRPSVSVEITLTMT